MGEIKTFYKRNLPHFQPLGYSYFITVRLMGSLPKQVIERLKKEKEKELEWIASYNNNRVKTEKYLEFKRRYFKIYDEYLDKGFIWTKMVEEQRGSKYY